ncbi:hypothetical protein [Cellulomonas sp.]|uniref:hypothetical protein n=1 Tax=Cellulomonas sp. TaxID=40001 RepID=UPI001B0FADB9|nr:hypothetical protein [Cellulomonas sp.]MBO9555614.1 hypothetical protein [Cellulomonas sp.]
MADLDARVTFHGSPDLTITEGPDYELVTVTVGDRTWRRRTAEGPYMHGRVLLGAVLETTSLDIVIRCKGATYVAAQNRLGSLLAYVQRLEHQVTVYVDGHFTTYTCEPADSSAPLEKFRAMRGWQEVTLSIPIAPV